MRELKNHRNLTNLVVIFKSIMKKKNKTKVRDKEQEERTIFIGNLPSNVSKKTLNGIFAKIGKIETIRLRGAARPDLKTTKKQAIIQRSFHENRHNIIAYI